MPKLNTTVKSVRIDNDKLELLEKRLGGRSINSWLNEQIAEYLAGKPENSEKNVSLTAKYGINEDDLAEMDSMRMFMGGSVGVMIRGITEALCEGRILYENGRFIGMPEIDLDEFKEACRDIGMKPEEVLEKATQNIRRTGKWN